MVEMVKIKNVIDNRMQCTPKPCLSLPQDVLEVKPINGFRTGSGALRWIYLNIFLIKEHIQNSKGVYNLKSHVWTRTRIASFCKTQTDYKVDYMRDNWKEVHRHTFTYLLWPCRAIPCFQTHLLTAWFPGCPKVSSDFQGLFLAVSVPASLRSFSGTLPIYRLPSFSWISPFLCLPCLELLKLFGFMEAPLFSKGTRYSQTSDPAQTLLYF